MPVRALLEERGIPVAWRGSLPALHRVREIAAFLDWLSGIGHEPVTAATLADALRTLAGEPGTAATWAGLLADLVTDWREEAGDGPVPASRCLEFCYESLGEQRRDGTLGRGVLLSTLHGAKGLEFPHVLIADGPGNGGAGADPDEQRRLYYVGMTRARETLALGRIPGGDNPDPMLFDGDWLLRSSVDCPPPAREVLARRYEPLTPADLDLGFAGRRRPEDPIHDRLAALETGSTLTPATSGEGVLLCDASGFAVARLSRRAAARWLSRLGQVESVRVLAMLRRRQDDGDPGYRDACRTRQWEYPLAEILWCADDSAHGARSR